MNSFDNAATVWQFVRLRFCDKMNVRHPFCIWLMVHGVWNNLGDLNSLFQRCLKGISLYYVVWYSTPLRLPFLWSHPVQIPCKNIWFGIEILISSHLVLHNLWMSPKIQKFLKFKFTGNKKTWRICF